MFIGTTTPLTGNAAFTSDVHITDRVDQLGGIVKTDQSGSLTVQQSSDGTNWDYTDTQAVTSTGAKFVFDLVAPYVRIVYTNGATPQTSFRLAARGRSAGDS